MRGVIKSREATTARADGVVLVKRLHFLTSTTPSAPSKEASRHFLDVAATPPLLRRGALHAPKFVSVHEIHACLDHDLQSVIRLESIVS